MIENVNSCPKVKCKNKLSGLSSLISYIPGKRAIKGSYSLDPNKMPACTPHST